MEENLTVAVTPLADRAFEDGRKRDREKGSMGERQTSSPRRRAGRVWASQSARAVGIRLTALTAKCGLC